MIDNNRIVTALLCFLLFTIHVAVQGSDSDRVMQLGLEESIKMALLYHPKIKEAGFGVKIAESKHDVARGSRYPRVALQNISGVVPEARGDATFSPDKDTDIDELGPFNQLKVRVYQPLYTFGRLSAGIEAARYNIEVAKAGVATTRAEIVYQVKQIYYGLLLATKLHGMINEVEKEFQKAITTAQERLKKGESDVREIDILKLKVGLSEIQKQLKRLKKEIDVGSEAFRMMLGLGDQVSFELDGKLRPIKVDIHRLEEHLNKVFEYRPSWKQLELGVSAKKAEVQVEHKSRYPIIFLAGEFRHAVAPNRDDQTNPFVSDDFNYLGGGMAFGFKWDWDFTIKAKIEGVEYELEELLAKREIAVIGFPLEVKKTYLELLEKKEILKISHQGKKSARNLMVLSLANYNFGIGEPAELFESLGLYIASASGYHKAVHDFNMALAKLSLVIGIEFAQLNYEL